MEQGRETFEEEENRARTIWPFQREEKSILVTFAHLHEEEKVKRRHPWLVASSIDIRKRYYDPSIGSDWPFHETLHSFGIKEG